MEQSLEILYKELELYIAENWVPPAEDKQENIPFLSDEEHKDIADKNRSVCDFPSICNR